MNPQGQITHLLRKWGKGDEKAGEELTPLVYDELRRIAARLFRRERSGHTLQPTALVHEAYGKLVDVNVAWTDRAHFYSLAARIMRRLLVDHAKARNAAKRGGGAIRVTLDEDRLADGGTDVLDIDEALTTLGNLDPRQAELIELQYFGGLSIREMEQVSGLSSSTLSRELRSARAWLTRHLRDQPHN